MESLRIAPKNPETLRQHGLFENGETAGHRRHVPHPDVRLRIRSQSKWHAGVARRHAPQTSAMVHTDANGDIHEQQVTAAIPETLKPRGNPT